MSQQGTPHPTLSQDFRDVKGYAAFQMLSFEAHGANNACPASLGSILQSASLLCLGYQPATSTSTIFSTHSLLRE